MEVIKFMFGWLIRWLRQGYASRTRRMAELRGNHLLLDSFRRRRQPWRNVEGKRIPARGLDADVRNS